MAKAFFFLWHQWMMQTDAMSLHASYSFVFHLHQSIIYQTTHSPSVPQS